MAETLPEGTDHVLPGAADMSRHDAEPQTERADTASAMKDEAADLRDKASARAADLKEQATAKARDYADQGKARASSALDEVARFISDSAAQIDEKLGKGYGDYVRRAGDGVSGFAGTLRDRDVEELIDDARDLVRRSPAVAIGAAATVGFMLARIIRAGSEALDETARSSEPAGDDAQAPKAARKSSKGGKAKSSDAGNG